MNVITIKAELSVSSMRPGRPGRSQEDMNMDTTQANTHPQSGNSSKSSKCVSAYRLFLAFVFVSVCFFSCLCAHRLVWSDLWRLMALWAKLDFVLGKSKEHSLPRGRTSVRVLSLATGLHASMCSSTVCACISWGCYVHVCACIGFFFFFFFQITSATVLWQKCVLTSLLNKKRSKKTSNLIWKMLMDRWKITETSEAEALQRRRVEGAQNKTWNTLNVTHCWWHFFVASTVDTKPRIPADAAHISFPHVYSPLRSIAKGVLVVVIW